MRRNGMTFRAIVSMPDGSFRYIDLPETESGDLWESLKAYDRENYTCLYDLLEPESLSFQRKGGPSADYPLDRDDIRDLEHEKDLLSSGLIRYEDGQRMFRADILMPDDSLRYIFLPDVSKEDLWACVDAYDRANGTDLYDLLEPGQIEPTGFTGSRGLYPFCGDDLDVLMASRGCGAGEWTGTKPVRVSGTSWTVAITEGCRMLGVEPGQYVEVTIRKI